MNRWTIQILAAAFLLMAMPYPLPAPLVYRPGEGWVYEPVGGTGDWAKGRAKDQLEVAKAAFEAGEYSLAIRSSRRVVSQWPLSDYAADAQYYLGRAYEETGRDEQAFKTYQTMLEKYPKATNCQEVLHREFAIANKYLAGKWFWKWGFIPLFSSMDKTIEMYNKIIKDGAYSDVAPQSQMNIGEAREKQKEYELAAAAYELAADRYSDQQAIASTALLNAGLAYEKKAATAEYDQSLAGKAIATFSDFKALYPNDARGKEADMAIALMTTEQARGNFEIAKYYEKRKAYAGAEIYYNEVTVRAPNSSYAILAKERLEYLKSMTPARPPATAAPPAPAQPGNKPPGAP